MAFVKTFYFVQYKLMKCCGLFRFCCITEGTLHGEKIAVESLDDLPRISIQCSCYVVVQGCDLPLICMLVQLEMDYHFFLSC